MADETETHSEPSASAPPRRRAPRASSRTKAGGTKSEEAKADAKPAPTRRTSSKAQSEAKAQAKPAPAKRAPAKPRAAKRQTPAPKRRKSEASTVDKAAEKVGGKWGAAAIAGGVAAVGAAAAALLTLRGSSRNTVQPGSTGKTKPVAVEPATPAHAHQPDGTNSSKSFEAGIADENTIPEA